MRRILLLLAMVLVLGGCNTAPAQMVNAPSGKIIWVELDRMRLILYENGKEIARFPIAAGARDTPTPVGIYAVNRRYVTELSGFGTRFMGLNIPFGNISLVT